MKSIKLCVLSLFAIAFLCAPNSCLAGLMDNPRVAVVHFANKAADHSISIHDGMLEDLRSIAEIDIMNASDFQYVDRAELKRILDEMQLQRSGLVDPATISKLGKFLGAEYLVLGTVTSVSRDRGKYKSHVTLRMVAVETAAVALSGRGTGAASNLNDSLEKATEDALDGKRGILTMLRGRRR
ncbi:MAG: hypothetical protein IKN43_10090 [Selenomonadaceae bacterium]|nr:hypothetical protein [Selenomonadaceae bacterium]